MAEANVVGVCSLARLRGAEVFGKLNKHPGTLMGELGHESVAQITGLAQPALAESTWTSLGFAFDAEPCTECRKFVPSCPHAARALENAAITLDESLCRSCGLCASPCPTGAIALVEIP